ncbi:SCO family protein, partial [Persephonella sp.]
GLPYLQKVDDFTLTDHNGKKVKLSDFRDKIVLVFFGYTFCPDVCPATMLRIKETLENLGDYKKYVKVLFISVDPERDTPEKLKEYVNFYDKDGTIIGLTGTPEEIKKVARSFRAFYEKVPVKDNPEVGYLMDHTAYIYLLDNRGLLKLIYSPRKDNPKRIAEDIIQMIKLLKMEK